MTKNPSIDGRVRHATTADLPAIARLMRRAQIEDGISRISEPEIADLMVRGEVIVLGVEAEELIAAACLVTTTDRDHLAFVVVDPAAAGVEPRIRGVAASLIESKRTIRHAL
jgi:N-acetylglutamate synthase-like GNAT family acetyltransferase